MGRGHPVADFDGCGVWLIYLFVDKGRTEVIHAPNNKFGSLSLYGCPLGNHKLIIVPRAYSL